MLLKRAYNNIKNDNPKSLINDDYNMNISFKMIPPKILIEGTKKTVIMNFRDLCERMNRILDHVCKFILYELSTTGSLTNNNNSLKIKGKYKSNVIETIIKKYIKEFLLCNQCKSPKTIIIKENRLNYIECRNCNSKYTIKSLKNPLILKKT